MKYSEFEKHAQKTLSLDVENVNIEALLGSLSLGQKPKKRFPFLWVGIALLGVLFTVGTWAYLQRSSDVYGTKQVAVKNLSNDLSEKENIRNEAPNNDDRSTIIASALNDDEIEASATELTRSEIEKEDTKNISTLKREAKTKSSKKQSNHSIKTRDTNQGAENKSVNTTIIAASTNVLNQSNTTSSSFQSNKKPSNFSTNTVETAAISTTSARSTETTSLLSTLEAEELLLGKRDIDMGDPIKCPSFKEGSRFNFDIIPEIGYMVPDKSLSDENPENSLVTSLRKDKEKSLEGLQAALYGRVTMDDNPFYLKAGLSYTRLSERMPLEYDYIESDTTIGIISISSNPAGDTTTIVMGEIITETQFTGNTTRHYYLHQWDLPIAIGYERPMGGFMLGVEGGLNVNLRTSVTGYTLASQDLFRPAERGSDISRRVGLGFFGGVSVGKYFSGIGDVYLAARARYIPDVSADAAQTDQSYMVYGLHAGYVYRF